MLGFPGSIVRINLGDNPPHTALTEIYEPPFPGYSPRGMDIDRNGVVWVPLASGHMGAFDRRKCKVLNGPTATGAHCPEGWTLYRLAGTAARGRGRPGNRQRGIELLHLGRSARHVRSGQRRADRHWQQFRFAARRWWTASSSQLRVPYPMGFFAKGLDGRIDDPNGGWKGRGLWATTGNRTPFHLEGGKGTLPKVVKFQLRPDPLAR